MTSTCRLTDDWLPLPAHVLAALGWSNGDTLALEVVDGVILVTREAQPDTPAARVAPAKRRSIKAEL